MYVTFRPAPAPKYKVALTELAERAANGEAEPSTECKAIRAATVSSSAYQALGHSILLEAGLEPTEWRLSAMTAERREPNEKSPVAFLTLSPNGAH